ncbi:MAG: ankyrin repeat domain-containing protein, partial [Gammaproteobacteria bacterium]|nr:ankyrin repeat domain-containing protein [Gammaproteobacteria bacterium]
MVILVVGAGATTAATDPRTLNLGLLDAAKSGDGELVASSLSDGASLSTRDRFGNTALIYASRGGH